MSTIAATSLKEEWLKIRIEQPRLRIRDAATQLGVSEAALLASFAGTSVTRLEPQMKALIADMPKLGRVMCLTRNESAVHERKGVFESVDVSHQFMGLVVGKDIDLRLFFSCWAFAFAVMDDEAAGFKSSIQFFDKQGQAVLKLYATPETNTTELTELIRCYTAPIQERDLQTTPPAAAPVYLDEQVDKTGFLSDWAALKDTHDFFPMLKKHQVSRLGAMKLGGEFTQELNTDIATHLLQKASAEAWQIMVFVSNAGCIQIHTGPVNKILPIPGWINVMDHDFNLHLKTGDVDSAWLVKKPTADGVVHSIELFDKQGQLIVQFFGKRKPGSAELENWRDGVLALADLHHK